jgi:hypothetical protein
MRIEFAVAALLWLGLSVACHPNPEPDSKPVPPGLEQYVLDQLPADLEHRTLVDFEGKVHLLGVALRPTGPVAPGSQVTLTLYWKSVAPLGPGWSLFTHLVGSGGQRVTSGAEGDGGFDDIGPLRQRANQAGPQALPPSKWTVGKIYVDTQQLSIPRTIRSRELAILVGIAQPSPKAYAARDAGAGAETGSAAAAEPELEADAGAAREPPAMRLRIVAGPSDEHNRALVARVKTTWRPSASDARRSEARKSHRAKPRAPRSGRAGLLRPRPGRAASPRRP